MALIGISGKSSSGKDEVGKIIQYLTLKNLQNFPDYSFVGFKRDLDNKLANQSEWKIKKFAAKLKSSIEHKFPTLFNAQMWENGGSEYRDQVILFGLTRRELLIKEAMLMRNNIHQDYWVQTLMSEYTFDPYQYQEGTSTYAQYGHPDWIVTDMRFENELNAIIDKSGVCVRVERPGIKLIDSVSETSLDHIVGQGRGLDDVIVNDGDIEGLVQATKHWMTTRGLLNG